LDQEIKILYISISYLKNIIEFLMIRSGQLGLTRSSGWLGLSGQRVGQVIGPARHI